MRVDVPALGSGVVLALVGLVILLDSSGAIDLTLGWIAVALIAAVGIILLLSGLAGGAPSRHD